MNMVVRGEVLDTPSSSRSTAPVAVEFVGAATQHPADVGRRCVSIGAVATSTGNHTSEGEKKKASECNRICEGQKKT